MSKIGKNRRSVSNLEREIYLAINDWIKGQGGGCLLAENQLPTRTTQKSLRFHGLRDGRSESRARETFFFFSTIEIEFSEFSNRWRFDLFHDVSVRRNFAKLTIERDRFWLWREKIRAKRARDRSNVTIDA